MSLNLHHVSVSCTVASYNSIHPDLNHIYHHIPGTGRTSPALLHSRVAYLPELIYSWFRHIDDLLPRTVLRHLSVNSDLRSVLSIIMGTSWLRYQLVVKYRGENTECKYVHKLNPWHDKRIQICKFLLYTRSVHRRCQTWQKGVGWTCRVHTSTLSPYCRSQTGYKGPQCINVGNTGGYAPTHTLRLTTLCVIEGRVTLHPSSWDRGLNQHLYGLISNINTTTKTAPSTNTVAMLKKAGGSLSGWKNTKIDKIRRGNTGGGGASVHIGGDSPPAFNSAQQHAVDRLLMNGLKNVR